MKKFEFSSLLLVSCSILLAVCACGEKKSIIDDGNPFLGLPLEKRLELAKKYDDISRLYDGLARFDYKGKIGFIDKLGKVVIPCMYDDAYSFSDALACVKLNGKVDLLINRARLL